MEAVRQLLRVEKDGAYCNRLGKSVGQLTDSDRRRVTSIVHGATRKKALLRHWIDRYAKGKVEEEMKCILEVAFYEFQEGKAPAHAVVHECVDIVKQIVRPQAAGWANAVLRAALREKDELGSFPVPSLPIQMEGISTHQRKKEWVEVLSLVHSHPSWMVSRWLDRFGEEECVSLLESNNQDRPTYGLRVARTEAFQEADLHEMETASSPRSEEETGSNDEQGEAGMHPYPLPAGFNHVDPTPIAKGDARLLLDACRRLGAEASPSTWYPEEFVRVHRGLQRILRSGLVERGGCAVQDEASALAVLALDPRPGDSVLDACAAPGGKALFAARRLQGKGSLMAMDVSAKKLSALSRASRAQGVGSVLRIASQDLLDMDPEKDPRWGTYDRVLVDAPCTGTGVLAKRPDLRWRRTPEDLMRLSKLQRSLLSRASQATRPGGILVYSTCSIEPEENDQVADWFLSVHSEYVISPFMNASTGRIQVFPHRHGVDGAFVARFRRMDPNEAGRRA